MSKRLSRELIAAAERLVGVSPAFEQFARRKYRQELNLATTVASGLARPTAVGDEVLEAAVRTLDQPWDVKTKRAHKLRKGDHILVDDYVWKVEWVRAHRSLFLVGLDDGSRMSIGRASDVTVIAADKKVRENVGLQLELSVR